MFFDQVCAEVSGADGNILAAIMLDGEAKMIGSFLKKGILHLRSEELERMYMQSMIMLKMAASNQKLFGELQSVTIRHEKLDGILIPLSDDRVLVVGCSNPYNERKVLDKIDVILAKFQELFE